MFYRYLYVICVASLVNFSSQSPESDFCDINKFPASPDNKSFPSIVAKADLNYTALYEISDSSRFDSEEIYEVFSKNSKILIAIDTAQGNVVKTYSDYGTDELTAVFGFRSSKPTCKVLSLKDNIELTPWKISIDGSGNEIPVSPLSYLFNRFGYTKFVYTGNSNFVRGIPVDEWKTCEYGEITSKITYSFSDDKRWVPSNLSPDFLSVPVQIKYEKLDISTNKTSTIVYTITSFKPYVKESEDHYALPKGVYCQGKKSQKAIPTLTKSFSYMKTVVTSYGDHSEEGFVKSSKHYYSQDLNLFKYKLIQKNEEIELLHDFTTGMKYEYNHIKGRCYISTIEVPSLDNYESTVDIDAADPKQLKLKTPTQFFNFDGTNPIYAGQRQLDGISTDVWIGQVDKTTYEWYFMSAGYEQIGISSRLPTPLLIVKTDTVFNTNDQTDEKSSIPTYYSGFQYLSEAVDYSRIMKICYDRLTRKHYTFRVPESETDLVRNFIPQFKLGVLKALKEMTKVTFTRITDIEMDLSDYSAYVRFTITEKPFRNGTVLVNDDVSLKEAIALLQERFNNKDEPLKITMELPDNQESLKVSVDQDSLFEQDEEGRNIIRQSVYDLGYSGGSVFFLVIFALVNGFMVSILVVELHKFKIINLPFLNVASV